ncbi:MAG: hypothetical protein IKU55_03390 [Clostridia bacterium]|nr:hypothetical protein [Clostridia bacterium]
MAVKEINRFEAAVCALESQKPYRGGILLCGSSTFARFPSDLVAAIAPDMVNHGFGGSTAEEALYYYPRLVAPCEPRVLVWYEGDNDPHFGYTADRAFALSRRVWERARADFPGLGLVLVGVKESRGEDEANAVRRAYDRRLREYVRSRKFAAYVDLPAIARKDGALEADGVHLTRSGYETLAEAIHTAISEVDRGKL